MGTVMPSEACLDRLGTAVRRMLDGGPDWHCISEGKEVAPGILVVDIDPGAQIEQVSTQMCEYAKETGSRVGAFWRSTQGFSIYADPGEIAADVVARWNVGVAAGM